MQRKIDPVGQYARNGTNCAVDKTRGNKQICQLLLLRKRGSVNHSRNADGKHRYAERSFIQRVPVIPNAGAGRDPGIADLHRAAKTGELRASQSIDSDHTGGMDFIAKSANLVGALKTCRTENAGTAKNGRAKETKL